MVKTTAGSKQKILITGGSGLIGQRLSRSLYEKGCSVMHLSRTLGKGVRYPVFKWDVPDQKVDIEAIRQADTIIHLAGENVAGHRWTKARKKEICDSRVNSSRLLFNAVKAHNPQLKQLISASAIGFYGWDSGDVLMNERSAKGKGFLADIVENWEKEIERFSEIGIKHAVIRIGMALSASGGALPKIAKAINWGAGSPMASGRQYISWIHEDDLVRIFIHVLENGLSGIYNGVAPNPRTNKDFTVQLAKKLGKALVLPNIPYFALRLMVGEMAVLLAGGNRVSCEKIEKTGFKFDHPSLDAALNALY